MGGDNGVVDQVPRFNMGRTAESYIIRMEIKTKNPSWSANGKMDRHYI